MLIIKVDCFSFRFGYTLGFSKLIGDCLVTEDCSEAVRRSRNLCGTVQVYIYVYGISRPQDGGEGGGIGTQPLS
jgi:hypothetical protein